MSNRNRIGHWALYAIECHFPVFPLIPGGKRPVYEKGCYEATLSRHRVIGHWARYPNHNYGIATGNGLLVLDIDAPNIEEALQALCAENEPLTPTVTVITPKGRHLYLKANGVLVGNSVGKLGPGIDVRGDGGYVVGAGSVHPSGQLYRYAEGHDPRSIPIAEAPAWLLELARKPEPPKPASPNAAPNPPKSERDTRYGQAVLDSELRRLASAPLHQRNNTLNRCAFRLGQLIAASYLDEAVVIERLTQIATEIRLEPGEIARTIRSGVDAGKRFPRQKSRPTAKSISKRTDSDEGNRVTAKLARLGCTDTDNAERFAERHGARFTHCPALGWLYFDGKRWKPDSERKRIRAAMQTARRIGDESACLPDKGDRQQRATHAQRSLSKAAIDRMLDLAAALMVVDAAKLDADPWLLNVTNGTLDLRTANLHRHDPRDMITKLAPVKYDAKAEAPVFRRFMRRVLNGNAELCKYLQRDVGYSLTGNTSEQVFFYVRGREKNGKSTFVNAVRDMMGDHAIHTPTETLMTKTYDNNIPNDIARLKGARMVTAIEATPGRQLDEARIKAMTGGDPLTARFMRAEWFTFTPDFKLWLVANDDPRVRSTDAALWRRIRVIPFDVAIPDRERDPDLPNKLRAEFPGILAWAVRGCLQWQRIGLSTPDVVLAATSSYRKRADHLRRFLRECVIQEEHADTKSSLVYQAYTDWCESNHERPLTMAQFKRQLEDLGFQHARVQSGSVWRQIRLRR